MAIGHMNVKRIIRRSLEEINATKEIARETCLREALLTFLAKIDIQLMNRNGFQEPPKVRRRLIKKHETMIKYFEKTFEAFCNDYDYDNASTDIVSNIGERIWLCWWQGEEKAPQLVKKCFESIRRNAGEYPVTVITEENYREYVDTPNWIQEKYEKGIISRTHYSDLLRLNLLAKHGGIWLDATFFCVNSNIEEYLKCPIWSIKRPNYSYCSVASGYFATYSLGCNQEHRWVYAIIRDFLLEYWKKNDTLVDYLTFDYLIVLAQRKDFRIAKVFADIVPNNPCCDELCKVLGEVFDEKKWHKLKENTSLFKLTWKQEFPMKKNGHDTFYAKLLDGTL